jgi:hypothetical protein
LIHSKIKNRKDEFNLQLPEIDTDILELVFRDEDFIEEEKRNDIIKEDELSYKYIMRHSVQDKVACRSLESVQNDLNNKLLNDIVHFKV